MLKNIISQRKLLQGLFAVLIYWAAVKFQINLLYIILFGSLLGVFLGKVFCRWMCPIGFIVELLFKFQKSNTQQQLYMYHKAGCPIAWVSGWLNKFSFLKISNNSSGCIKCGKCDQACYIAALNPQFSFFKPKKELPSVQYSCSRCLECVKACPTSSLSLSATK